MNAARVNASHIKVAAPKVGVRAEKLASLIKRLISKHDVGA